MEVSSTDLPKIHTVGLSVPPPKIHTAGHPPFPIPQPHSPSGAQNQSMGNWPQRGPHGGAFCTPHFGPMGKWPQIQKNWGGCNFGNPPFWVPRGHLPFFAVSDSWASEDHMDHPHTYGYLTYRPQTYLSWGKPKLNSFFSFPIPHTGGNLQIYTKEWRECRLMLWSPILRLTIS